MSEICTEIPKAVVRKMNRKGRSCMITSTLEAKKLQES